MPFTPPPGTALRWEINFNIEFYRQYFKRIDESDPEDPLRSAVDGGGGRGGRGEGAGPRAAEGNTGAGAGAVGSGGVGDEGAAEEVERHRQWSVHEVVMGEWRTLALLGRLCNERA